MITPEDGITQGVWNPFSRMAALFTASYFAGMFYPLPETVYHLIIGPQAFDGGISTHTARYLDFKAVPFIGTLLLSTGFLSFPLFFFCMICSALDRWWVRETTVLGATVSFSLLFADDLNHGYGWAFEIGVFSIVTFGIYFGVLWLLNKLAEQVRPDRPPTAP